MKKDHVGLPPGMVLVVPADVAVLGQGVFQKFRLKMVYLLESDKIGFHLFQKIFDHIPASFPAVFVIFCQAEAQVHGHHAERCRICFHSFRMRYSWLCVNFYRCTSGLKNEKIFLAF